MKVVTGTDNEFTECQTPRKKLQSIGISPVSLHTVPQHCQITNAKMKFDKVMNTIKSDISESILTILTVVKLTILKIQSLILKIKMVWKKKQMTWLGCTKQCKKN